MKVTNDSVAAAVRLWRGRVHGNRGQGSEPAVEAGVGLFAFEVVVILAIAVAGHRLGSRQRAVR